MYGRRRVDVMYLRALSSVVHLAISGSVSLTTLKFKLDLGMIEGTALSVLLGKVRRGWCSGNPVSSGGIRVHRVEGGKRKGKGKRESSFL